MDLKTRYSVLIADDHDLIRLALKKIFEPYTDYGADFEAKDYFELMALLKSDNPDIVLLDLNMPGKSGFELLKEVRGAFPLVRVIVLTVDDSPELVEKALELGALGYLLKENATEEIRSALDSVVRGKTYISRELSARLITFKKISGQNPLTTLSKRELEVLFLICQGKTNKEIGSILFLSEKTVRNYSTSVFRKLDVSDRLGASIIAQRNGIERLLGTIVLTKSGHL